MFKIYFNETLISTYETEKEAIGLCIYLHNVSNIPHNIFVTKDNEPIITLILK